VEVGRGNGDAVGAGGGEYVFWIIGAVVGAIVGAVVAEKTGNGEVVAETNGNGEDEFVIGAHAEITTVKKKTLKIRFFFILIPKQNY